MNKRISAEEFRKGEAIRLGISEEKLKIIAGDPRECNCRYKDCPGWEWDIKAIGRVVQEIKRTA